MMVTARAITTTMAAKLITASILWMPILSAGFVISGTSIDKNSRARALPTTTKPELLLPSSHHMTIMMTSSSIIENDRNNMIEALSSPSTMASSLASDYAIRICPSSHNADGKCGELKWEMYPLRHWEQQNQGEGTLAMRALADCTKLDDGADEICTLSCQWTRSEKDDIWSIAVAADGKDDIVPRELVCLLSRVMVQSAASQIASTSTDEETLLRITLPLVEGKGCQQLLYRADDPTTNAATLFTPLNSQYAKMEIVDMVNQRGEVLGSLPRPYIHTWNILHRGIGMVVSKDNDILSKEAFEPELYVHQRTATKRIFPSLYDMFVGGVSSSGEDSQLTAAREVSEELGLTRGLDIILENKAKADEKNSPLSEQLFQCTICTSYNRCVVSMFTYTCDTELESITWQEEEVAWGDFVPYDIVEMAGDMSIDRLIEKGVWPGSEYSNENSKSATDDAAMKNKYGNISPWDSWDFVPDGLLVWEAWKSFRRQEK